MKRLHFLFFAVLSVALLSCKQRVYLTVAEPAAVFLEKEYETAGVINRSYSSGASTIVDAVDNALTLEGNLDHKGSKAAVQGVFDELSVNPRFQSVKLLDSMTVNGGGIDVFPAQLTWDEVDRICEANQVQLLFVLEFYDTDTKVDYSQEMVNQNTPLGTVQVPRHTATMRTTVKTGWRIYDPKNRWVRDEFWLRDVHRTSGSGINPAKALGTLMKRGQAVQQLSTQIGRFYAGRVRDQRFRVWRNYFNKGSRKLKIATRRSEVGDWDGAAELWLEETKSPKRKVAGRACYNMAIYAEINGDLQGAIDWAQKAYADYGNRQALDYANILRNRKLRWENNQRRKELDEQGN